jgi:hypothetical protein
MNEKEDAQKAADDTPHAAQPPLPPPVNPSPVCDDLEQGGDQRRKKMSKSDLIMSFATIVIAIGTLVSAAAIALQWREMVNGGADTTAIKTAAQQQAGAAQQFAATAGDIKSSIDDAVKKLDVQAQNSAASIKATQDSIRQDQRAWIGLSGFKIEKDLRVPGNISNDSAAVQIFNSGKTPGRNVQAIVGLGFENHDYILNHSDSMWFQKFMDDIYTGKATPDPNGWGKGNMGISYRRFFRNNYPVIVESIAIGIIPPNTIVPYKHPETWHAGTNVHEFLFGEIRYKDIYGVLRHTKFCIYRPDQVEDRMIPCPVFNNMD